MIKNKNEVEIYEKDGVTTNEIGLPPVVIRSHWVKDGFVVIKVPDSAYEVTVSAKDLRAAIDNATNTAKF